MIETAQLGKTFQIISLPRPLALSHSYNLSLSPSLPLSWLRWLVSLAVGQVLLCYRAAVVLGHSSGVRRLPTVTEWARLHTTAQPTTHLPSDTTPLTSTLSTAACLPSACRTEEGEASFHCHSLTTQHTVSRVLRSGRRRRKRCGEVKHLCLFVVSCCSGTVAGPGATGAAGTPTAT